MAVSGTISTTSFDAIEVIEAAFRRCRYPNEVATAENLDIARKALYLVMSTLPQYGLQLWTVEKAVFGLAQGQAWLTLPVGTLDIDRVSLRLSNLATGTDTVTTTQIIRDLGASGSQSISSVGFTSSTAQTLKPVVSVSNDGTTYTQTGAATIVCSAGGIYWVDLDPVTSVRYIKIVDATGATLNITSGTFQTAYTPSEYTLPRESQDTYVDSPNKTYQSTPTFYWLYRQRDAPVMRFWPAADAYTAANRQIVVWRTRYLMDVGDLTNTIDVPQKWLDAVISILASKLPREIKDIDAQIIPQLDKDMQQALALAQGEDADAGPMRLMPDLSPYTR